MAVFAFFASQSIAKRILIKSNKKLLNNRHFPPVKCSGPKFAFHLVKKRVRASQY